MENKVNQIFYMFNKLYLANAFFSNLGYEFHNVPN